MKNVNIEVKNTKVIIWNEQVKLSTGAGTLEIPFKYADYKGMFEFNRKVSHKCFESGTHIIHVFFNNDCSINSIKVFTKTGNKRFYPLCDFIYRKGVIWKKISYLHINFEYSKIIYIYKNEKLDNEEIYSKKGLIVERKYYNYDRGVIRHYFYDDNGNNIGNVLESVIDE